MASTPTPFLTQAVSESPLPGTAFPAKFTWYPAIVFSLIFKVAFDKVLKE